MTAILRISLVVVRRSSEVEGHAGQAEPECKFSNTLSFKIVENNLFSEMMLLILHKIFRIVLTNFCGTVALHLGLHFQFPHSEKQLLEDARSFVIPGQCISAATDQHPMVSQSKQ